MYISLSLYIYIYIYTYIIQVGFAQTAALVVLVQALENIEKLCGLARGVPETATENLENSKQSYEKRVISFVKLACLFCKASARRRSIDLIFFCKVSSSTSDFLFILSLFFELLASILEVLGHLWRAFGPSERPVRFRTSFLRSFFDFWSALGAQEAPKGAPRSAKATKMVPKVVQKGAKSDLERLFF